MFKFKTYLLLRALLVTVFVWMLPACSSSSDEWDEDEEGMVQLDHYVRVLVLGNSFSLDATAYLNDLISAAKINQRQIGIYNCTISGGGLEEWLEVGRNGTRKEFQRVAGRYPMNGYGSLTEVLGQEWDVVVIMQSSDKSYQWSTYEGVLDGLIEVIRGSVLNKDVKIMFAMPWAHTRLLTERELTGNIECARRVQSDYGLDMIPVGIAIQNARGTRLCDDSYLTRDNWHLCYGVGRYIAACTWYEALLAGVSHLSVVGNPATHPLSKSERNQSGSIAVDESNRLLCQKCAYYAVTDTFTVRENIE